METAPAAETRLPGPQKAADRPAIAPEPPQGQRSAPGFSLRAALRARSMALPAEHGAWVFFFAPLIIGLALGGLRPASLPLVVGALAAFLLRQPLTQGVKMHSGRRRNRELPLALFWLAVYGLISCLCAAMLIRMGSGSVLLLALPAAPVLAWQLALVARRAERRRYDVEIAASAVLALAAPAALWTGQGRIALGSGGLLWLLLALHAAGTILHAALRLKQRALKELPTRRQSLHMALPALGYNLALWLGIAGLAAAHRLPAGLALAYALQPLEVLWAALHPAPGIAPQKIGFRQLAVTGLFVILFIVGMKI